MSRYTIALCVVAAILLASWWLDFASHAPAQRTALPALPAHIYAAGRIEGVRPETKLRPWHSGRVIEVAVSEGQFVESGEVLLRMDNQQHRHDLAVAQAELNRVQAEFDRLINGARTEEREEAVARYRASLAQLERSRLTWNRTQTLRADGVVSQQQADDDRTRMTRLQAEVAAEGARMKLLQAPARDDEVRAAQARVAATKANLELARLRLQRRELRAPFAGQALQVNVEPGEMSGPQASQAAVILADTRRLRVRAYVEELEAPRIKVGMSARILVDGLPDKQFEGCVTQVSPRMGLKQLLTNAPNELYDTKTREIWIDLNNSKDLVVGLRVDVMIARGSQRQAAEPVEAATSSQPPSRKDRPSL